MSSSHKIIKSITNQSFIHIQSTQTIGHPTSIQATDRVSKEWYSRCLYSPAELNCASRLWPTLHLWPIYNMIYIRRKFGKLYNCIMCLCMNFFVFINYIMNLHVHVKTFKCDLTTIYSLIRALFYAIQDFSETREDY